MTEKNRNSKIKEDTKEKKEIGVEILKILMTAIITSISTCCVWSIQSRSENKREDKYKKIEVIQEYAEVCTEYELLVQQIIDNKHTWLVAILLDEYYGSNSDLNSYATIEKTFRKEHQQLISEYMGILSTIGILFDLDEETLKMGETAETSIRNGFGFNESKYMQFFWEEVNAAGGKVSQEEMELILKDIDKLINEDCTYEFSKYSAEFINALRRTVK